MSKYGYSPKYGTSYNNSSSLFGTSFGTSYGSTSNYNSLPPNNPYTSRDSLNDFTYSDKYNSKNLSKYGSTSRLSSIPSRSTSSYSPDILPSTPLYSKTSHLKSTFNKSSYPYSSNTMDFGISYTSKKPETFHYGPLQNTNYTSNNSAFESRRRARENASSVPPLSIDRQLSNSSDNTGPNQQLLRQNSGPNNDYCTLINRGTSPINTDNKIRDHSISRTETINIEVKDTTRKRQLKNVFVQVDPIFGRSISIKTDTSHKSILPKQSEFIPKNRTIRQINCQQSNEASDEIPISPGFYNKKIESQPPVEDFIVKQTSFIQRRPPVKHEAIERKIEKPLNSALKESMDKVKTWKKQLQTPDYQDNADDLEWRKRNPITKRNLSIQEEIPPTFVSSLKPPILNVNGYNSEDGSDKNNCLNSRSSSTLSLTDNLGAKSFMQRAASFTCLAENSSNEVLQNGISEKNKQKIGFITKLEDIDNLLDFDDSMEFNGEVKTSNNHDANTLDVNNFFVGASEDIDDLLESDIVPTYIGQPSTSAKPQVKTGSVTNRQANNPIKHYPQSPCISEQTPIFRETLEERNARLKKHCLVAIQTIESRIKNSSDKIEIQQLMDICRKSKDENKSYDFRKDMKFPGFVSIAEALEHMMIDVDKLDACAIRLYELSEEKYSDLKSKGVGILMPQSSFDEYYNPEDPTARITSAARVHVLIEILKSVRDVRKILFSLKKIFKNEKDCIKEFVHCGGLTVLMKIAMDNLSNSNYQCYILRTIGQLMLCVDGMNGVVSDNVVIHWLYTLSSLQFYPIVRTAFQLMIVFVEYSQCNSFLLTQAVSCVSKSKGKKMWSNFIDLLRQPDADLSGQFDIGVQVMTLLNKVLESIPDQDNFYDIVDGLQDQGIDKIFKSKVAVSKSMASLQATSSSQFQEQMKLFDDMIKNEDEQNSTICTSPTKRLAPRLKSKIPNRKSIYGVKKEEQIKKKKVPTATLR